MKSVRVISDPEKNLLVALLSSKPENHHLLSCLDSLLVAEMDDGKMGSLALSPSGTQATGRKFGRQIVLAQFPDTDGVVVSVAVNVDTQGKLFELDIWKTDFSSLLSWPEAKSITFVS